MALVGVAVEKAVSCRPLTGASPQPLQPLDLPSPSTIAAAEERPRQIQPPNAHQNPSLLCSPRTKASYLRRPPETKRGEHLLHGLAGGAGVEHQQGEGETGWTYSIAVLPPPSPRRQHKDTNPLDLLGPLPPTPTGKATAVPPPPDGPQAIGGGRDRRPRRRRPRRPFSPPQTVARREGSREGKRTRPAFLQALTYQEPGLGFSSVFSASVKIFSSCFSRSDHRTCNIKNIIEQ